MVASPDMPWSGRAGIASVLAVLGWAAGAAAEPTAVSGRVVDTLGQPIRGATVVSESGAEQTTTDGQGRFTLTVPLGVTLVVTSLRHGVALANVVGPDLGEITPLLGGEQIEIVGQAPTPAAGAATLDRQELQRLPGAGGDVVRALSVMPGVVNQQLPLGYSGVVIRGSSPQDSKILIDDFEIPVLFHPLGIRAVVPAESIETLTFIPGGFDVAYGRSSSGIVHLTTRPGGETRSTQAEVSLIDGGVLAQGSLGERTRYMAALRRSVIDFVLPVVIPSSVDLSLTTVPQYWDQQLRLDHELSSAWSLMLSSIGTSDVFELFTTKDEDAGSKRFYNRTRFLRLTAAAKYLRGPWQAKLALSGILSEIRAEIGLYQRLIVKTPQVTPRVEATRTMAKAVGLSDVVWRAGAEAQLGFSSIDIAIPLERRDGEPFSTYDPKDTATNFEGSVSFPDAAAWSSLAASLDPRVRLTLGLRVDAFGRPREAAVQPRGEVKLKLSSAWSVRLAGGAYRRPPEFQSELLEKQVQSEHAKQVTSGVEYTPLPGVNVQGSLYYTDRTSLITRNSDGSLGNNGRGHSQGAELLATIFTGSWFGWIGYSYSRSERVDRPGGASRLFDYDQPHSLNVATSWRRGAWQLGARFQLYSGLPYTPVVGAELDSDRNLYLPISGPINSGRAPLHHQVDLRLDYTWKWGPAVMLAYLDIQNVYLDRSVVTYFYSYDYSQRSAFESLPLLPSAGLRVVL